MALLVLSLIGCGGGSSPDSPDSGDPASDPGTPAAPTPTGTPTPPLQATSGPGGSDYRYPTSSSAHYGMNGTGYSLVLPEGAGSASLPVVYLLHGYGTLDLTPYQSWAEHLAKRGAIVIYPTYQVLFTTPVGDYTSNAVQGIQDALARVAAAGGVRADSSKVIAIGHSLGGVIAANITALAGSSGIPQPKALMTINPGNNDTGGLFVIPLEDLGQVPGSTLQLSLFSDRDQRVPDDLARDIFAGTTAVSLANKDYIIVNSDSHGIQPLDADHFAALAGRDTNGALYPPDALDYYGYWKLADALMSAAFENQLRDVALGGGSTAQRYMGTWGDGVAVTPLTVTDHP